MRDGFLAVDLVKVKGGDRAYPEMDWDPAIMLMQRLLSISSGSVSIASVNTEYDTAWKEGRLMFKDMPIPQVLKKLSYFYNVRFDVKDSVINTYRFTGTFENKLLSQILDYLKISSQIDYTIKQMTSDDSSGIQNETVILKKMR